MAIKRRNKDLGDAAKDAWIEAKELLILYQQALERAERTGKDCAEYREFGVMAAEWWEQTGWKYYPEMMPAKT